MKVFKALLSVLATLVLIWVLETKFGDLPPIAPFLNPATGFWQNAESKHSVKESDLKLKGLIGKIIIRYDENRIPHIFAENDHDLYFAQGYVTATDRLWQMDIQTRSAAGRLAEVVGPKALPIDEYHRRMGMVYGAENTLNEMMKDPHLRVMINAYTAGINAYIHTLWKRDYPIEFKLLDYDPEEWKPINCALLLKLMSETLAGHSDAAALTSVLKKFGPKVTNNLFPDQTMHEEPIIPAGTKWNFKALPLPKPSADFINAMTEPVLYKAKVEGIGSNNWVIAGNKTASGYPILANDPHLNLTFPSIWYQVQLSAPGVNTYGVSIPGAPCVIIGYNHDISWGETNVDADVLDFYRIRFKNVQRNEYWYNNQWLKTTKRIEQINIRGQVPVYDTVVYTQQGPVPYETAAKRPAAYDDIPVGTAVRWIAHDRSKDMLTFYLLNRAKNYDDYHKALSYYTAPAQNFVFASRIDIAMTVNGKFPLKFRDQGKYVLDGSDTADSWQGWIPFEQNPTAKNPARGYLSSANQSPTDATYPYYLNWSFGPYERGKRINDRLAAMQKATVDSLRILQSDTYSIGAQGVLPALIGYIDASKLDAVQQQAFNILKHWNKRFDAQETGATIFNAWWLKFYEMVWADEFDTKDHSLLYPSRDRTEQLLLKEPDSKWFDNIHTSVKETCADIVNRSFVSAVNQLLHQHGEPGKTWEWGNVKSTYINHLANLPGFGTGQIVTGGSSSVVNALVDGHGPSWRMVVQMGPKVEGYGIFPGGQSGNPGSRYYDDMLKTWEAGQLKPLLFLQSPTEPSNRIQSTLTITN